MPRNYNFDKPNKSGKDIYNNITNGLVKENLKKDFRKKKKPFISFLKIIFKLFLFLMILGLSLLAGATVAVWSFSAKLPDISKIQEYTPSETSEIYDVNGKLLAKLHDEENRTIVPLSEIPSNVQNAVIAMEDERFYQHMGIDPKAIVRAVSSYFNKSLVKGGASTITQQLARNLFLTPEVKITRKIAEWMLAIKIERKFSKAKILELYLNQVYWGHNSYGVEAASRTFFGKSIKDVNLAEASMMGGLLSSPEVYSPLRDLKLAKWRQSLTLANMVKNGFITKSQADKAKNTPIKLFSLRRSYKLLHPYFTSYVISVLTEKYGDNLLRKGGLKVYTTMDPEAQELAEELIAKEIPKLKRSNNISQGAIVSLDPNTGFIKTIVGGISYEQSQFNRATQAKRQPGSAFKPFVYVTAFNEGIITPGTIEVDSPISYPDMNGVWTPKNYDGSYHGAMTIKDALKKSINVIAVKILDKAGVDNVIETAKRFGIESYIGPNLSIALGSAEVVPLELAGAYGVFATGGKKPKYITPILKIEDRNGNIIENYEYQELEQVFPQKPIEMLNECTKAVVDSGTGYSARLSGRIVAGKTGTTSDHRDSWFIGYVPQLVTLVWIGNDDNSKMWHVTGGVFCAPIWKKYMMAVTKGMPVKDFPKAKKDDKEGGNADDTVETDEIISNTTDEVQDEKTHKPVPSFAKPEKEPIIKEINPDKPENNESEPLPSASNIQNLDVIEITPSSRTNEKSQGNPQEENKAEINTPSSVQSISPSKKETGKTNQKTDEDVNSAMEDLKNVKELYNSR